MPVNGAGFVATGGIGHELSSPPTTFADDDAAVCVQDNKGVAEPSDVCTTLRYIVYDQQIFRSHFFQNDKL